MAATDQHDRVGPEPPIARVSPDREVDIGAITRALVERQTFAGLFAIPKNSGGQMSAIFPFPSQHHTVSHGQADIFNSPVGLDQTVKGNDGVIIRVVRMEDFATPQDVVGHDQSARLEQREARLIIIGVVGLVGVDENQIERTG